MTTLVFDVLGTVVDIAESMATEFGSAVGVDDSAARSLAEQYLDRALQRQRLIASGQAEWESPDAISRSVIDELSRDNGMSLDRATIEGLATAGHRLRAWPDAAPGLRTLSEKYLLVSLSNADMSALADLAYENNLIWHCQLSGELVRSYKPDAAMYQMALDMLRLDAGQTMLVAAHAYDLRAAAEHGMRTAYLDRPAGEPPGPSDRFDVQVSSLTELPQAIETGALVV